MSKWLVLWRRELAAYFLSPTAYVVAIFFLLLMGLSFWLLVGVLIQGPSGVSAMGELFGSLFFWLAMLVTIPLLTMRLFTEEKSLGTLETLMTAPVNDSTVVLAKYAGALTFFVILWIPTGLYPFLLRQFSSSPGIVDAGALCSAYFGTFLVGAFYISVGLLCSLLAANAMVAAMSAFAAIGITFFLGFLAYVGRDETVRDAFERVSSIAHMLDFARGLVDTRAIVLYLSLTALMLFAAVRLLESRRWIS